MTPTAMSEHVDDAKGHVSYFDLIGFSESEERPGPGNLMRSCGRSSKIERLIPDELYVSIHHYEINKSLLDDTMIDLARAKAVIMVKKIYLADCSKIG